MASYRKHVSKDGKITYTATVRRRGHPTDCATFKSLTKAKEWARNTESDIHQGRHFKAVESKKHTLEDLIDRYTRSEVFTRKKDAVRQKEQLQWWKRQLGKYLLCDVTPSLLAENRDKLAQEEKAESKKRRSPATVKRYLAALSHCFTIGVKEFGWLDDNPMRNVSKPKESKGRVRYLLDAERANLLDACKKSRNRYLYPIVVLGLSTGMRHSEIMGLTWRNVDFKRGLVSVVETARGDTTKNEESRCVPLTGHALELLEGLSKIHRLDTDLVFPAPMVPGQQAKPIDIKNAWKWAVKRAEIDNFRFHDLRHCAATYLAQAGATVPELAATLGHKTLAMVKRYQHLTGEHVSPVVAKMNAQIFAPEAEEPEGEQEA